jgi:transcriptional regulator with XRE-family HTH domain
MGGKGSGNHKPKRKRKAAELQARGLSLAEIGRRLGVSKQAAHQLLGYRGTRPPRRPRRREILCPGCGASLGLALSQHDIAPALCLPCLDRRPDAPLGERLRALRHAAGLSRDRLARAAGLSAKALSAIERGVSAPRPETVQRLAAALEVGVWRLRGSGRPK